MKSEYPLQRNIITYLGFAAALVAFIIGVILIITDIYLEQENPYNSLVTYLIIPMIIGGGISFGFLGIIIEYFRRKRARAKEIPLPRIDLNDPLTRNKLFVLLIVVSIFFAVSSVGVYRSYIYTDSTRFCGLTCHKIMKPEYTAYQESPHARVHCVDCHIGEGAEWYVRSKMSGLRQVWRTMLNSYELPIKVPIENLRPARETCEKCHWPEKFTGSIERIRWHFWTDEENTPSKYHLIMKVGGISSESGRPEGIHWHTSSENKIRYWPEDFQRLKIPWVEITDKNNRKKIFKTEDAPTNPPEEEIRVMDCMDCHNRPAHVYKSPDTMVNLNMAAGNISRKLPYVKQESLEILDSEYKDETTAQWEIDKAIREAFPLEKNSPYSQEDVNFASSTLSSIYSRTYFPEQKISWKTYPNHIGHREFPGCFRCHDEQHSNSTGETISKDCNLCHDFVFQAHGEDAYGPVTYKSGPFEHPGGMEDIWEGSLCTDCHGPENK